MRKIECNIMCNKCIHKIHLIDTKEMGIYEEYCTNDECFDNVNKGIYRKDETLKEFYKDLANK